MEEAKRFNAKCVAEDQNLLDTILVKCAKNTWSIMFLEILPTINPWNWVEILHALLLMGGNLSCLHFMEYSLIYAPSDVHGFTKEKKKLRSHCLGEAQFYYQYSKRSYYSYYSKMTSESAARLMLHTHTMLHFLVSLKCLQRALVSM